MDQLSSLQDRGRLPALVGYAFVEGGTAGTSATIGRFIRHASRPTQLCVADPDEASYATIHFMEKILNRRCGGSTGTNLYAAFQLITELEAQGREASVVSMICDGGERYLDTYYNDAWLAENNFDIQPCLKQLDVFYETGVWSPH